MVKRAGALVLTKMSIDSPASTDCREQYPSIVEARTPVSLSSRTCVSCQSSAPGWRFSLATDVAAVVCALSGPAALCSAPTSVVAAEALMNCRRPTPACLRVFMGRCVFPGRGTGER